MLRGHAAEWSSRTRCSSEQACVQGTVAADAQSQTERVGPAASRIEPCWMAPMGELRFCLVAALLILPMMSGPAVAQAMQQQIASCQNSNNAFAPDQQIVGCTVLIKSGRETERNLTFDYHSRGNAYRAEGDHDHAIADYTE